MTLEPFKSTFAFKIEPEISRTMKSTKSNFTGAGAGAGAWYGISSIGGWLYCGFASASVRYILINTIAPIKLALIWN